MQQSPSNPSVTAPLHKYHYRHYHLHAMPAPLERTDSITSFSGGTSGGTHYCRNIDGHVWRCNVVDGQQRTLCAMIVSDGWCNIAYRDTHQGMAQLGRVCGQS